MMEISMDHSILGNSVVALILRHRERATTSLPALAVTSDVMAAAPVSLARPNHHYHQSYNLLLRSLSYLPPSLSPSRTRPHIIHTYIHTSYHLPAQAILPSLLILLCISALDLPLRPTSSYRQSSPKSILCHCLSSLVLLAQ